MYIVSRQVFSPHPAANEKQEEEEAASAPRTEAPPPRAPPRAHWNCVKMVLALGSARWSARFVSGPLPVMKVCVANPKTATIASLPFAISFFLRSMSFSSLVFEYPSGSNHLPAG